MNTLNSWFGPALLTGLMLSTIIASAVGAYVSLLRLIAQLGG